jgi:hypothetical protein
VSGDSALWRSLQARRGRSARRLPWLPRSMKSALEYNTAKFKPEDDDPVSPMD